MNPKDLVGQTKPNLSILPFAPLLEVCGALTEGAIKYGPENWRDENVSETIYADAAIRHLMQFLSGEDVDADSGISHVSKAIAGLLILRDAQIHGCSDDNRGHKQNLNIPGVMKQIASVRERHADTTGPTPAATPSGCCKGSFLSDDDLHSLMTVSRVNPALVQYSITVAGGGAYVLTQADVGKLVLLSNGAKATIQSWGPPDCTPVCFARDVSWVVGEHYCTAEGFEPSHLNIVKVFH